MYKAFFKFFISLIILTAFVFIASSVFFHSFPGKQPAAINYLYLFFFAITALVHFILIKASGKRPQQFPTYFMLATTVKLFSSFILIVSYAYFNKTEATRFILTFFLFYIIYTVFEIISILRYLKKQKSDLKQ